MCCRRSKGIRNLECIYTRADMKRQAAVRWCARSSFVAVGLPPCCGSLGSRQIMPKFTVGSALDVLILLVFGCAAFAVLCASLVYEPFQVRDPTTLAVLLEDSAACVGVLIAIVGTG